MSTHLHVRDLPNEIHRRLTERAQQRGMSLRRYTIEILTDHCRLPTLDEWLQELEDLPSVPSRISGAEAVRRAREEEDREILSARPGS
jgi:plasmid stability protein